MFLLWFGIKKFPAFTFNATITTARTFKRRIQSHIYNERYHPNYLLDRTDELNRRYKDTFDESKIIDPELAKRLDEELATEGEDGLNKAIDCIDTAMEENSYDEDQWSLQILRDIFDSLRLCQPRFFISSLRKLVEQIPNLKFFLDESEGIMMEEVLETEIIDETIVEFDDEDIEEIISDLEESVDNSITESEQVDSVQITREEVYVDDDDSVYPEELTDSEYFDDMPETKSDSDSDPDDEPLREVQKLIGQIYERNPLD